MLGDLPPYLLALTSAFLFALGGQFQFIGLRHVSARAGTALSIGSSAGLYWLIAPFKLNPAYLLDSAVLIFVLIGVFRPTVSANMAVTGIRYLGPTLTATLSSTSPMFGAAFGVLLLGEVLSWPVALGTAGIVLAVVSLSKRGSTESDWPVWALFLPIGAAAIRSFGHVLSKIGMAFIPDPYFAGLISFTVSAVITNGEQFIKRRRGARSDAAAINWKTHGPYLFILSGILMGSAVLSLNTALLNGEIITVVPIVASSPIFSMLLSVLVFRREHLSARIIAAVFIVVPSVILIALN